jgi:hypothetical protein
MLLELKLYHACDPMTHLSGVHSLTIWHTVNSVATLKTNGTFFAVWDETMGGRVLHRNGAGGAAGQRILLASSSSAPPFVSLGRLLLSFGC